MYSYAQDCRVWDSREEGDWGRRIESSVGIKSRRKLEKAQSDQHHHSWNQNYSGMSCTRNRDANPALLISSEPENLVLF